MQDLKEERKFKRQCVSCKEYKDKSELIRLTKDYKSNELQINEDNSLNGRSLYICKNEKCLETAIKKKKIEHFLKTNLSEKLKEELYTVLNK